MRITSQLAGKRALFWPTSGPGRRFPVMLPPGSAGWNRHQPPSRVSVPADIQGGDEVAEERPAGLNDVLSVRK